MRAIFQKENILLLISVLIVISGLVLLNNSGVFNAINETILISEKLDEEINLVNKEIEPVISKVKNSERLSFSDFNSITTKYAYFVYEKGNIIYWSKNDYVPKYIDLIGEYEQKYINTRKGEFVVSKFEVNGREIYSIIPLTSFSLIENQYLFSSVNFSIFKTDEFRLSKTDRKGVFPVAVKGRVLFYIDYADQGSNLGNESRDSAVIILFIGLLFVVGWCFIISYKIARKQPGYGIVLLVSLIAIVRYISLLNDWQINAFGISFFNPEVFASSELSPTLADLFINIMLLVAIGAFVVAVIPSKLKLKLNRRNDIIDVLLGLVSGIGLWQVYLLIETLYHNSNYTLDITQSIEFSSERILIVIVFIFSGAFFILYSHAIYKVFISLTSKQNGWRRELLFLIGVLLFGFVIHFIDQPNWVMICLVVAYYAIIRFVGLDINESKVNYVLFTNVLIGVIVMALFTSLSVSAMEHDRAVKNKKRFAEQFLIGNDVLGEYLLLEANDNVSNDAFIKNRMFTPFLSKEAVKDKVRKVYLSTYFDKYDIKISLFDTKGHSFDNEESLLDYKKDLSDDLIEEEKQELYFINNYQGEFTKGYLSISEIRNYGIKCGYVAIRLKLKKIIPDNVYPDLLVDSRFLLPYENKNYSYAIFSEGKPVFSSGEYNYQQNFDLKAVAEHKKDESGYCHTQLEDVSGKLIIVSSPCYKASDVFANFSFYVLSMILLVIVMLLGYGTYFYFSERSLNYSARIQLYFNWAFFLPLIAISTATIQLVKESYNDEIQYEHYKKAMIIGRSLQQVVERDTILSGDGLQNDLNLASTLTNTDANLFDLNGRLIASSQPLIYKKNVLSEYLNPNALSKIIEEQNHSFTTKEKVGTLEYNTTYVGLKSSISGEQLGVLSVPYFQSEFNLEREKMEIFGNMVKVFLVVFIIFLIISYFASKWLTFPLRFITQKLKATKLSEINEPLTWKQNDEIGLMVSEYNKMIVNLDESRKALARTEKESAWRTIAQQVAHEIKNPLTPMKLTLQHVQRTLQEKDNELKKPLNSMLRQVDTLTDIVSSFSSFAQMPIPEHEKYELTALVHQSIVLHKSKITIQEDVVDEKIYTMGDEKVMGRIISNMLLNAEQSASSNINVSVRLKVLNDKKVQLEVQDDGDGIAKDIQEKIFIPNFTTKETGSGIGLAIAKHGIEHAGGEIWFETSEGKGTTFFITLPKVD